MTTSSRFERRLPDILEDLYLGPTPDYRDQVLATATRSRQRPAWAIPGRWIPMADIASRPTFVPRLPVRSLVLALVILALLVAAAIVVGSRQNSVPPPFGVARNGLLATTSGGDILTIDPVSGAVKTIVAGVGIDSSPLFSPDGTHVEFLRLHDPGGVEAYDVMVAAVDGSNPMVVSDKPLVGDKPDMGWSPDGRFLYTSSPAGLDRYDVSRIDVKRILPFQTGIDFQPPDGRRILFSREGTSDAGLYLMDADGSNIRPLIKAEIATPDQPGIGDWHFSPDGTKVIYGQRSANDPRQYRIHIVNSDGSGARQLSLEPGTWYEGQLAWSPDGSKIAFNRWDLDAPTEAQMIRAIGVISITDGKVIGVGPVPDHNGARFEWSPDGTSIVSLPAGNAGQPIVTDIATGTSRELSTTVEPELTWQRQAH